jgi:hypothetical protein
MHLTVMEIAGGIRTCFSNLIFKTHTDQQCESLYGMYGAALQSGCGKNNTTMNEPDADAAPFSL